jgi:outer membrane receptor for ferrienterochelin and colicins
MDGTGSGISAAPRKADKLNSAIPIQQNSVSHFLAVLWGVLAFLLSIGAPAQAVESEDISHLYGADSMISLATGYSRPLFDAPATAYTITREQIQALGAENLVQVLQTLPGFYPATNDGRSYQSSVRGITNRVLILVNGLPLDEGLLNATLSANDILTYDIDHVEITLGPGSSLFGADAVAGTINLVTRTSTAALIDEVGVLGGTEDSYSGYVVHNAPINSSLRLGLYAAAYNTDGDDSTLKADAQSAVDRQLHTHASLAPGPLNLARKVVDTRAELSGDEWTARASYRNEYDFHTGTGLAFALDPWGTYDSSLKTVELVGHHTTQNDWHLRGYATFTEVGQPAENLHLYPPGSFGGTFPQGVLQSFKLKEDRFRAETSAEYTASVSHRLLVGLGAFHNRFDVLSDDRNYVIRKGRVIPTGHFAAYGGVADAPLLDNTAQTVYYLLAQDEWSITRDLILTAGGRYDHYSELGGTFNPRASLVWNESAKSVVKLLYGRAFRTPTIIETESNGTYAPLGNPELKPVTLDMLELAFNRRFLRGTWQASVFGYEQSNLVETTPDPASPTLLAYANHASKDRSWGSQLTGEYQFSAQWSIQSHYTYQRHTVASDVDPNIPQAPHHQFYSELKWQIASSWSAGLRGLYVAGRGRAANDPRPDPKNYVVAGLSIERRNILDRIDMRLFGDNIFNTAYAYPSDSPTLLPYDIPAPGRMWWLSAVVHL